MRDEAAVTAAEPKQPFAFGKEVKHSTRTPVPGLVAAVAVLAAGTAASDKNWTSFGPDDQNTRYQDTENKISVDTVAGLTVKWAFTTDGDVSDTPAVDGTWLGI